MHSLFQAGYQPYDYYGDDYYGVRQQMGPPPGQQFGPGFPGFFPLRDLERRVRRLENELDRLTRQVNRLERRVDRLEGSRDS
jgi:hypothetical protein